MHISYKFKLVKVKKSLDDRRHLYWMDDLMALSNMMLSGVGVWCWSALKESGYESDSTLVFKRRDETAAAQQPSLAEQRLAYKTIQRGGEVPLHGLRKPAPERPKGLLLLLFAFLSTPAPDPQTQSLFFYPYTSFIFNSSPFKLLDPLLQHSQLVWNVYAVLFKHSLK